MIVHNEINQNSPEWFQIRCGKLTASDAQAIATRGKGLETLVAKKVAEILTGEAEENGYTNQFMENGHTLEDDARIAYELETGNIVDCVGFCERDKWSGASPDGMVGEDGLVEIKNKIGYLFVLEMLDDKIDSGHYWQTQYQLWVTGRQWCDYLVHNPRFPKKLIIKRVTRDEDAIAKIEAGVNDGIAQIESMLAQIKCLSI